MLSCQKFGVMQYRKVNACVRLSKCSTLTMQPGAVADYTTGFMAAYGSLLALQRRALYGGSYLVRVSLSQTGEADEAGYADGEEKTTDNFGDWVKE